MLGPTLRKLRPGARGARTDAQRATAAVRAPDDPADPKNQMRPFARAGAGRRSTALRPALRDLAKIDARTWRRASSVLNKLLNALAYNPPGTSEGYLF